MRGMSASAADGGDDFGCGSEPSPVRSKAVAPDPLSPCRVVVARVGSGAFLLHHDPRVDREDAAPAHCAGREDPDKGVRMRGRGLRQAGARTISCLPVVAAVAEPEVSGRRGGDRREHEQQECEQELLQPEGALGGCVLLHIVDRSVRAIPTQLAKSASNVRSDLPRHVPPACRRSSGTIGASSWKPWAARAYAHARVLFTDDCRSAYVFPRRGLPYLEASSLISTKPLSMPWRKSGAPGKNDWRLCRVHRAELVA
jgi:hypothetical protein